MIGYHQVSSEYLVTEQDNSYVHSKIYKRAWYETAPGHLYEHCEQLEVIAPFIIAAISIIFIVIRETQAFNNICQRL